MNPRERILALSVGALAALMGGFYLFSQVESGFKRQQQIVQRLRDERGQKERQIRIGRLALERLEGYRERSLPPDPAQARQLYTDWLLKTVTDIGFSEPKVSPATGGLRSRTDTYTAHAFSVGGVGSLEMLTTLLYQFYSVDYLHRIKILQVTPRDSKTIAFSMTVEALSLAEAPQRDALHHPPSDRLTGDELAAYVEAICGRNMFGPPNAPPQLSVASTTARAGQQVVVTPSASDPDEDDTLTFRWESEDVTDAQFDSQTGRLAWTPEEPGEYAVTILASDDGVPSRSVSQTVTIRVEEPSPPAVETVQDESNPPYDQVQFTFVNGVTEVNGRRQVWMIDRQSGRKFWLAEGDRFEVGDFEATVERIGPLDVEFQWYDRRALVPLGENLGEDKELTDGELVNLRQARNEP